MDRWYVYALKSLGDEQLYIGISEDPHRRLQSHNKGATQSTRSRRPFVLIFQEACGSRKAAREREKYYKSGFGREILKKNNSSVAQSAERVAVNH
jgi:putative endonuclease